MSAAESRPVLEVWSEGGKVLEGVFEVTERADADLYVAHLGECGVRAKVLAVDLRGVSLRRPAVEKAWAETPFPPKWYVIVQQGSELPEAVYEESELPQAELRRAELQAAGRVFYDLRAWLHPERPVLGQSYRQRKVVSPGG